MDAGAGRIKRAALCDALERDTRPVDVEDGKAIVPVTSNITSVRLVS